MANSSQINPFWNYYAKSWDPIFSHQRISKDDRFYVQHARDMNAEGDAFSIFWQYDNIEPSWEFDDVAEFCQGANLENLKKGGWGAGQRYSAWLDDRDLTESTYMQSPREYKNPLTASQLYYFLKIPRFGNTRIPDANRRLIYITNLDPYYILALIETASSLQVPVLRDAIWKHLTLQISIQVQIPPKGFKIFQLGFHLPYFALRTPSLLPEAENSLRQWKDVSFLKIQSPKSQDGKVYRLFEAQTSVVIYGEHASSWVAYAFVDTDPDGEELCDELSPCEGLHLDPISGELDAEHPICDPRRYFLRVLNARVSQVRKEWNFVVGMVERSIKRYRETYSFSLLGNPRGARYRATELKESSQWTVETLTILRLLIGLLTKTIEAWEKFNGQDGDIGYFSDIGEPISSDLRAIKMEFEKLQDHQNTLQTTKQRCEDFLRDLERKHEMSSPSSWLDYLPDMSSTSSLLDYLPFLKENPESSRTIYPYVERSFQNAILPHLESEIENTSTGSTTSTPSTQLSFRNSEILHQENRSENSSTGSMTTTPYKQLSIGNFEIGRLEYRPENNSTVPTTSTPYNELSFRKSEFRLLKFMAPWTGTDLVCSLVTIPLPKAPRYVALSYYWGNPTDNVNIRLNDFDFPVTTNLYQALLRLRAEGIQYVWADALCINQEDDDERSMQVTRMGTIYQKAGQVAAWLGAEPNVGEAMEHLGASTGYIALDLCPEITNPTMFHELLSRPYWGRVWIIQEVALASDVVVYFGRYSISWDKFVNQCGLQLDGTALFSTLADNNTRGIASLLQFRNDRLTDRPISFLEALSRSRSSLATDPRDKLFALLGLCFNGKKFLPEPNYMDSPEEIFTEFTTALIKYSATLDFIYLKSASRNNSGNMPSWVPDWTDLDDIVARRQFDHLVKGPSRDSGYNDFTWKNSIDISDMELTVRGVLVDTVFSLRSKPSGNRDIGDPSIAKSQTQAQTDPVFDAVGLIYEAITGVGLLPDRADDVKDQFYADMGDSWSDDQAAEYERLLLYEHESTLELLALIQSWLATNPSLNIAGRDLECWLKMLALRGNQIGDLRRIADHFYDSIRCGMRLVVTQKGYLGWIHPQAQEGDNIARIFGCSQHVVLRATQNRYLVVGDAVFPRAETRDQEHGGHKSEVLHII